MSTFLFMQEHVQTKYDNHRNSTPNELMGGCCRNSAAPQMIGYHRNSAGSSNDRMAQKFCGPLNSRMFAEMMFGML